MWCKSLREGKTEIKVRDVGYGSLLPTEDGSAFFVLGRNGIHMYEYRILKYIGAYTAVLGGVDVIAFTAGVGENSPELREAICEKLAYMGITLDKEANRSRGKEVEISGKDSKVKVVVIPTDEDLVIAQDTAMIVGK